MQVSRKKHCVRRQQKYLSQDRQFWANSWKAPGHTAPALCCAGLLCCSEITPAPVSGGLALVCSSGASCVSLHHHFPLYPLIKSAGSCPGKHLPSQLLKSSQGTALFWGWGFVTRARIRDERSFHSIPNLGKAILSAPDPYSESLWSRQD